MRHVEADLQKEVRHVEADLQKEVRHVEADLQVRLDREEILPLSAKSEPALRELAGRYARHLASASDTPFADVCFSASTGRAALTWRVAVVAGSAAQARERLTRFAEGKNADEVFHGRATDVGRGLLVAPKPQSGEGGTPRQAGHGQPPEGAG